jgi:hypothetical protein
MIRAWVLLGGLTLLLVAAGCGPGGQPTPGNTATPSVRTTTPPTKPTPTGAAVKGAQSILSRGDPADFGYWYSITLIAFRPDSAVSVVCRDSVDPNGFKTITMTTDDHGSAGNGRACYSGDGPEHWFTADGLESNHLTWSTTGTVLLARGPAAPHGYWYTVSLSGFEPDTEVSVVCHDSVDTGGFSSVTVHTDGQGAATIAQACYSGDGPDHWVTANSTMSNHVTW